MKNEWKKGSPKKSGEYLTLREKINGKKYIHTNTWLSEEDAKEKNTIIGWQTQVRDASKIIEWLFNKKLE